MSALLMLLVETVSFTNVNSVCMCVCVCGVSGVSGVCVCVTCIASRSGSTACLAIYSPMKGRHTEIKIRVRMKIQDGGCRAHAESEHITHDPPTSTTLSLVSLS